GKGIFFTPQDCTNILGRMTFAPRTTPKVHTSYNPLKFVIPEFELPTTVKFEDTKEAIIALEQWKQRKAPIPSFPIFATARPLNETAKEEAIPPKTFKHFAETHPF